MSPDSFYYEETTFRFKSPYFAILVISGQRNCHTRVPTKLVLNTKHLNQLGQTMLLGGRLSDEVTF